LTEWRARINAAADLWGAEWMRRLNHPGRHE
jgi:hypothetical protein